jgi:hypothetical protein
MTTMRETDSQNPPPTGITPGIAANQLKKGIVDRAGQYAEPDDVKPSEGYVVRIGKKQTSVSFTVNTRRLVERREIERANEIKRRSGK